MADANAVSQDDEGHSAASRNLNIDQGAGPVRFAHPDSLVNVAISIESSGEEENVSHNATKLISEHFDVGDQTMVIQKQARNHSNLFNVAKSEEEVRMSKSRQA